MKILMEEKCDVEALKKLTTEIQKYFCKEDTKSIKWLLLKNYHDKCMLKEDFGNLYRTSYSSVLTTLLDVLKPTLFTEKGQETLYDRVFLQGVHHESFLILVNRLDTSDGYVLQKVLNLLQMFIKNSNLEALFFYQCVNHLDWDIKYISKSNIWEDLITSIVSLPERIANKTQGKFNKIFSPASYIPLLISSVFRVLCLIHNRLKNSGDSSLEFLAKLSGKICMIGYADIVAEKFSRELVKVSKNDFIWRRISQNFFSKMPLTALNSFITNLLLKIPWYGYTDWILGEEGIKNQKINCIMTQKVLFFHSFKEVLILQNTIGYFAMSPEREPHFMKILDSLLDSWVDERTLRHQSIEQKIYISSALMVCAGWLRKLNCKRGKDYINKVLKGTQIRLGSSEDTVRILGMVVGEQLIKSMDPDSPSLNFELDNMDLIDNLRSLTEIPLKPDETITSEDSEWFKEVEQNTSEEHSPEEAQVSSLNEDLDSDDDLEPYDTNNDIPQSNAKRPLYLRECMMGLVEQENAEWTEQCVKHAEELIKADPYATEEVAEEMAKIMLHMTDVPSVSDYVAIRHKILIALTVQCPLVVANYFSSQFTEREYTIRQRLDVLEVLAASSTLLSHSCPSLSASETEIPAVNEDFSKKEANWQKIISQRLEAKTKRYTKARNLAAIENKFSAIAGNFFYPLLNSYEKACNVLKLHSDDSYVLGRLVYTLGIIMYNASNTLQCGQMGSSLLQFLYSIRSHQDVFVRQSVLFAVAATYTAVPSSLLLNDMLSDVSNTNAWLREVAQSDLDGKCIEIALSAVSIFQKAAEENSTFLQLKKLKL